MPEPATSSEAEPEREKSPLARMAERLRKKLQDSGRTVRRVEPQATDELEVFVIPKARRSGSAPEKESSAD